MRNQASKNQELHELKEKLGSWMFTMLTRFSKDEFQHQLQACKNNERLRGFRERYENARDIYSQLQKHLTPRQYAFANMPFYYKIRPHPQQKINPLTEEIQTTMTLHYDLTSVCIKKVDITHKTETSQLYGAYVNVISESLLAEPQLQEIQKQKECFIDYELEQLGESIAATEEYFGEQEKLKTDRREAVEKQKLESLEKEIKMVEQGKEEEEEGTIGLNDLLDLEETQPKKKQGKKRKQTESVRETQEEINREVMDEKKRQKYDEAERQSRVAVKRALGHA